MQQQLTVNTLLHGGTYRILNVLGQGSFGITYLAEHVNLGRKVAIKEFFMKELNSRGDDGSITGMSDGSLSHSYGLKFKKEALNLAQLDHPNIVRVTDSFEENGTFYYVMDFIEGDNLNNYVKTNSISEQEAIAITTDVARALQYMHEEKHMLHLDLKPGNIMRRASDGHIFLIDFGLSKHYSDNGQPETSTTIGLGTAGYAPIEQSNQAKNGEFRPTIDVYALGATLYKLLTRQTPPPASDVVSDDELIENGLRANGITGSIIDCVVNAMLPNVKKRTQTVKAFLSSLPGSANTNSKMNSFVDTNSEETEYIRIPKSESEETEYINKKSTHPNFEESSYVIESKYWNYPTSTNTKASEGDLDAAIAIGMMALRGKGVQQNLDTAYSWFVFARDKGDDRGAKLVEQWVSLKNKYQKNDSASPSTENKSKNSNATIGIIAFIAFVIIVIAATKGCGNKTEQAPYYGVDTVDTVAVDTAAADTAGYYESAEDFSSGYHEVTYDDGTTYKGYFKNGDYDGQGTMTWPNGEMYEGSFKNGQRNGYGVYTWPYSKKHPDYMVRYEGNYYNGRRSGKGTAYYGDHTYQTGKWKRNDLISVTEEGTWE